MLNEKGKSHKRNQRKQKSELNNVRLKHDKKCLGEAKSLSEMVCLEKLIRNCDFF